MLTMCGWVSFVVQCQTQVCQNMICVNVFVYQYSLIFLLICNVLCCNMDIQSLIYIPGAIIDN